MKHLFTITRYSLLFTTLVLGITHAFGMMNCHKSLGGCKKVTVQHSSTQMEVETSTSDESKDQELLATELAIHDKKKLSTLLYDLITTMPPELIQIILDYDSYALKGTSKHSLSGQFHAFADNSLVELPNETVTVQEYSFSNIRLWDTKTGTFTKKLNTFSVSPLAYNDNKLILIGRNLAEAWIEHYDCRTDQRYASYNLDQNQIKDAQFDAHFFVQMSSQICAIGTIPGQIALLDTATNTLRTIRKRDGSYHGALARLSDTVLVLATQSFQQSGSNNIEFWNIENGTCFLTVPLKNIVSDFTLLSKNIFALIAFIPRVENVDAQWAIELWFWNQRTARCIKTIKLDKYQISALAKLSNGYLAAGLIAKDKYGKDLLQENLIKVFDPISAECKAQFGSNTDGAVCFLQPLSNGHLVALSHDYTINRNTIRHWE